MWFLLLLCFCLVSFGSNSRVINGQPATTNQYPVIKWQVAVEARSGNSVSLCGGSIISNQYILTAGHCVKDLSTGKYTNPQSITVKTGISRSFPAGSFAVQGLWAHPSYDGKTSGQSNRIDLGILQLASPLTFSSNVQAIKLCSDPAVCEVVGKTYVLSGYGETQSDVSSSTSQSLNWVYLQYVSESTCANAWAGNGLGTFPINNMCAGAKSPQTSADSCFGDSGGPLTIDTGNNNFMLVGVVSTGTVPSGSSLKACGEVNQYGVYVSVLKNKAWIDSITSGSGESSKITSSCVSAGTCSGTPVGVSPISGGGSFNYYPIIIGVVCGVVALIVVLLFVVCCRK